MRKTLLIPFFILALCNLAFTQEHKYWVGDTVNVRHWPNQMPEAYMDSTDYYLKHRDTAKGSWVVLYWDKEMKHKYREYKTADSGSYTEWYKEGQLGEKYAYPVEPDGIDEDTVWYPDGVIKKLAVNKDNTRQLIMYYHSKKVRQIDVSLLNKKEVYPFNYDWVYTEAWCENGQLIGRDSMKSVRPFLLTSYYCNGNKRLEGIIHYGHCYGILKMWYENGQLKSLEQYEDTITSNGHLNRAGIKTGKWSYFDEKGKLIKEEVYKDDVLIEKKKY